MADRISAHSAKDDRSFRRTRPWHTWNTTSDSTPTASAGREFKRSLKTNNGREANAIRGRIEETILLLERGRLEMPTDADPAAFILSDGRLAAKPKLPPIVTFGELFGTYEERLPDGVKERTTRLNEKIHQAHLLRHLKPRTVLSIPYACRHPELRGEDER